MAPFYLGSATALKQLKWQIRQLANAFPVTVTYLGLVMLYVAMARFLNTRLSPLLLPPSSGPYT